MQQSHPEKCSSRIQKNAAVAARKCSSDNQEMQQGQAGNAAVATSRMQQSHPEKCSNRIQKSAAVASRKMQQWQPGYAAVTTRKCSSGRQEMQQSQPAKCSSRSQIMQQQANQKRRRQEAVRQTGQGEEVTVGQSSEEAVLVHLDDVGHALLAVGHAHLRSASRGE